MENSIRILVVEDESQMAELLRLELTHEGYEATVAPDGENGLKLALSQAWDLMILDLMLPEVDGLEICRRVKAENNTPIIILTARGKVSDRVLGLNLGADDYMVKPFHTEELLARVKAVLRRNGLLDGGFELKVGDLVLDSRTRQVHRDGVMVNLSKTEFELLEFLMRNSPWVMSRDLILQRLWGYDFQGESNVVDVYIRYLRAKLDDPFPKKLIHSVRGVGYVIREDPNEI